MSLSACFSRRSTRDARTRRASRAPVLQHARVQEVLVDRGEFVLEDLVEMRNDFGVALHDELLELETGTGRGRGPESRSLRGAGPGIKGFVEHLPGAGLAGTAAGGDARCRTAVARNEHTPSSMAWCSRFSEMPWQTQTYMRCDPSALILVDERISIATSHSHCGNPDPPLGGLPNFRSGPGRCGVHHRRPFFFRVPAGAGPARIP